MLNKSKTNSFISLGDYFNPLHFDTLRHAAFTVGGSVAGFAATGNLNTSISFALSSYLLSIVLGPSKKALKNFYNKHIDKEKFPDFKIPKKSFSSKGLAYGSLMAVSGVVAGALVNQEIIDVIQQNGFDFSSFDSYQLETAKKFMKIAVLNTPILFSTGLFFGDSFNYIKNDMSFKKLLKSNLSLNPNERLELILSNAKQGVAGSNSHLISELYTQGRYNEALAYFFNNFFIDDVASKKISNSLAISNGLILEKKDLPLKFRLASSLSESLPEPFIDGLVSELVEESIISEDIPALTLAGFYFQTKKSPQAKSVWDEVGKQLNDKQDSLESKLFAKGTSEIKSINLSGQKVDIIESTLLRKQSANISGADLKISDEKKLNNHAYTKFLDDNSLNIPLLLDIGKTEKFVYSLLQLDRSASLFEVLKSNPEIFDQILPLWNSQSKKIDSVFNDALISKDVYFSEVDYASRIVNQKNQFNKRDFNSRLAYELLDRINISSLNVDFLKPSTDNLPEQWLYNLQKGVFSRLDFENKGLRRSMEDRVNSSMWIYDSFPEELISKSLDFQIDDFCKNNDVDINIASAYFLDVLFERRNHLLNTWIDRPHSLNFIPHLLNLVDLASRRLGKFVDNKTYLSYQRQQTNSFYDVFKSKKDLFKHPV